MACRTRVRPAGRRPGRGQRSEHAVTTARAFSGLSPCNQKVHNGTSRNTCRTSPATTSPQLDSRGRPPPPHRHCCAHHQPQANSVAGSPRLTDPTSLTSGTRLVSTHRACHPAAAPTWVPALAAVKLPPLIPVATARNHSGPSSAAHVRHEPNCGSGTRETEWDCHITGWRIRFFLAAGGPGEWGCRRPGGGRPGGGGGGGSKNWSVGPIRIAGADTSTNTCYCPASSNPVVGGTCPVTNSTLENCIHSPLILNTAVRLCSRCAIYVACC